MTIAIQASDLDHKRIDGTRVYLKELLKRFGLLAPEKDFVIYHKGVFNPLLAPPQFSNYQVKTLARSFAWMQTSFALEVFLQKPEKLFLPIQAAPFLLPRKTEVTATIHDLAFKKFPETFSPITGLKLNLMLFSVVRRAHKLIAVSESTKRDLISYFPNLDISKIRVIHHGFDADFFCKKLSDEEIQEHIKEYGLAKGGFVLYVGALQPRKNLVRLIHAFGEAKETCPEMKLVLAGESAWLSDPIHEARVKSKWKEDIIFTGRVSFETLRALYQGARIFAFPSLYEGFGLPILEAFASETAVLTADNSSLGEVAGDGALYCDAHEEKDIAEKMGMLWQDDALRRDLVEKGKKRLTEFSWEKCAEETLEYIEK